MLKEPVWIWSIPLYFYVGGAAGASAILGAAAQIFSEKEHKKLMAMPMDRSFGNYFRNRIIDL